MEMIWLSLAIACMLTDWAALWKGRPSINYVSKPLTLLFLLIWFIAATAPGQVRSAFALGLFFSLVGDGFLLLPPRYFIFGLAAFLLAHLSYVAGFAVGISMPPALFWAFAGLVGAILFKVVRQLVRAARRNPNHRKMVPAITVYAAAISVMLLMGTGTLFRPAWDAEAAVLAACGALLFTFSDLYLAFDRFVEPIPGARLMVRITYHLGQLALAAGIILYSRLA
jgi:uncharacterized membrane protein YhhN